jgi:hypothetical protein
MPGIVPEGFTVNELINGSWTANLLRGIIKVSVRTQVAMELYNMVTVFQWFPPRRFHCTSALKIFAVSYQCRNDKSYLPGLWTLAV